MPTSSLRRALALTGAAVVLATALTGCSIVSGLISSDAQRDDNGSVTEDAKIDVFNLKVGDCKMSDDATEVANADVVPCDTPHDEEVYFEFDLPDGDMPDDATVEAAVKEKCLPAFDEYVGLAYEESTLDLYWLQPTPDTWSQDDRLVQCILVHAAGEKLEGSMKGKAV